MKSIRTALLLTLITGVVLGVFGSRWLTKSAGLQGDTVQTAPGTPATSAVQTTGVQLATVTQVTLPHGVTAVGSLRSENAVVLRPEITGRITEINFTEGRKVTQGQTLVRLDDRVLAAQLQQAQANLSLANSQYRRAVALNKQGFISKQAQDEALSQLALQQAAVALAKAQLDKTVIQAPFDGVIGLRLVSLGDYVSPGSDLVPLESIQPLQVDFRIPEHYLAAVSVGSQISLTLDALPGQTHDGQVVAISPVVDVGGRSILLRANVPNVDEHLRPGMFARVQLRFVDQESLLVPETALSPSGESQYVFRVQDGRVQRVAVSVGLRRDAMVEILQGLDVGDQVVVSGLQKVKDGTLVHVLPSTPAAGA